MRLKNINQPLRLLIENEIFRLTVWANPSNEAKRGIDPHGSIDRNMLEVSTFLALRMVIHVFQ
jgi:phosphatidylinositol 4-kinase